MTVWSLRFIIMPNSPKRYRLLANDHIIYSWWLRTGSHMKFPRNLFLMIKLWDWKCHKQSQVLFVIKIPPTVLYVFVLLSSVLLNEAEVNTSRMMLLLAWVLASDLNRCFLWLTIRLASHYQLSGWWDDFGS
jgi:hypothetical protein